MGFVPDDVKISRAQDAGTDLLVRKFEITQLSAQGPIPADLGEVLSYSRSAWRDPQCEVFSWDRFPNVLVFDTADYGAQDDIFKRLAFFVEKPGYAGTIPDPREIASLHGWNAHDYRAEDLAKFYSVAQEKGIALTAGEVILRQDLVDSHIIQRQDTGYAPVGGAVISISRSSSDALRRLLLTHESFHGVFFSLPGYRTACQEAWNALTQTEKDVWTEFFRYTGYDTANTYLTVNEFQAYVCEQPRREVPAFQAVTLQKLRKAYPNKALFSRFVEEHPDSFLRSFDTLDQELRTLGAPGGGESIAIEVH